MLKLVFLIYASVFFTRVCGYQFVEDVKIGGDPQVIHLFSNITANMVGTGELEKAFNLTYRHFEKQFDAQVPNRKPARVALD